LGVVVDGVGVDEAVAAEGAQVGHDAVLVEEDVIGGLEA
jgi:hypothetical protein